MDNRLVGLNGDGDHGNGSKFRIASECAKTEEIWHPCGLTRTARRAAVTRRARQASRIGGYVKKACTACQSRWRLMPSPPECTMPANITNCLSLFGSAA
jgi:hypothetical protein